MHFQYSFKEPKQKVTKALYPSRKAAAGANAGTHMASQRVPTPPHPSWTTLPEEPESTNRYKAGPSQHQQPTSAFQKHAQIPQFIMTQNKLRPSLQDTETMLDKARNHCDLWLRALQDNLSQKIYRYGQPPAPTSTN
jgi:hypothetical protein